jgi:predicted O-linked N-acetylglucosamine transferase (SPINDLY family)
MSDICDWKYYEEITNKIINDLKNNLIKDPNTFILMHFCDINEIIKEATRIKVKPLLNDKEKFNFNLIKNKTIHIGYYSPDFRSHPVGYVMSQILEYHNREIFKITGFSLDPNPDPKSEITSKFINSFDTFLDCSKKSYIDIVEQSRKLKVDLAIDLTGFTSNNKIKIFANRAAPIQVNFLGYPSTLGVNHDYIVADLELIPKEKENFYFEKIIYMPNTYLPIYTKFNLDTQIKNNFDYKKFNFVFANFNHHGRITPIIFNSWINILKKVENSVLILNQGINKYSEENLLKEAIKKNLDPERILFSKRIEFNDHNSKFKNCDLYLDTFPYNAHTTAGTCLLSGVPILTIKGNHFQSRVSSSLLKNLKMDELITSNIDEYQNKAIYIANSQQEFQRIKGKLHDAIANSKIFNAKNYTEDLEKAFIKIYERHHQKLNPENVYI